MKTIRFQNDRDSGTHRRSGLAPLEMVLLTPWLVLMGALMICFGDAALWKIRAQTAVHYAGTQTESFRAAHFDQTPGANPRPANWPQPAAMGGGGGDVVENVRDKFWNRTASPQGREDVAALQGRLVDPYLGNELTVNRQFIADRGVHAGFVSLTRKFPMLTRLLPSNGTYRVELRPSDPRDPQPVGPDFLTGDWNFQNLGLGSNSQRRTGHLYDLDQFLWDDLEDLSENLRKMMRSPTYKFEYGLERPAIDVLDNDPDWDRYYPGIRPPDFHPHPPRGCELELMDYMASPAYARHLRQIRLVPLSLASRWRSVYQTELNNRQDPTYIPKGSLEPGELKSRIDTLTRFISNLPPDFQ